MNELLLVVMIGGRRAGLRAAQVQSVIEIETLVPVPLAPHPIVGLTALRSRMLTVIDCRLLLTGDPAPGLGKAVVVEVQGHSYALLLDFVLDITPSRSDIMPLRADAGAGWVEAAEGMVETDAGPLILLAAQRLACPLALGRAA